MPGKAALKAEHLFTTRSTPYYDYGAVSGKYTIELCKRDGKGAGIECVR